MLIALCLALAAAPALEAETSTTTAVAPKPKKKRRERPGIGLGKVAGFRLALDGELEAGLTAVDGLSVRHDHFLASLASVELTFSAKRRPFGLSIPVGLAHTETSGARLRETKGRVYLELSYEPGKWLRIALEGGLRAALRPGWPDLYQPTIDGGLLPSDRHSYLERRAGLEVSGAPFDHQRASIKYTYALADYLDDPAFDPLGAPTHLVPGDHQEQRLRASWRIALSPFSVTLRGDGRLRDYFFEFARDAGTGLTHTGAGGAPPNPLLSLIEIEPGALVALTALAGRLRVAFGYGYDVVIDTHQGYYSFRADHPEASLALRLGDGIELAGKVELRDMSYGSGSYAPGRSHPPLTEGDRLHDQRLGAELTAKAPLGRHWYLLLEASAIRRRTNYPLYEAGVFPRTKAYDIDWNFDNTRFQVGVGYAL